MEARLEAEVELAWERLWASEGSDAAHKAWLEEAVNVAHERLWAMRGSAWHNNGLVVTTPLGDEGRRVECLPYRRGQVHRIVKVPAKKKNKRPSSSA